MPRVGLVLWALCVALSGPSCTIESRLGIEVRGASPFATAYELHVLNDGQCPDIFDVASGQIETVHSQIYAEGNGTPVGELEPGSYAFVMVARAGDCRVIQAVCSFVEIGPDAAPIVLELQDVDRPVEPRCPPDGCDSSLCVNLCEDCPGNCCEGGCCDGTCCVDGTCCDGVCCGGACCDGVCEASGVCRQVCEVDSCPTCEADGDGCLRQAGEVVLEGVCCSGLCCAGTCSEGLCLTECSEGVACESCLANEPVCVLSEGMGMCCETQCCAATDSCTHDGTGCESECGVDTTTSPLHCGHCDCSCGFGDARCLGGQCYLGVGTVIRARLDVRTPDLNSVADIAQLRDVWVTLVARAPSQGFGAPPGASRFRNNGATLRTEAWFTSIREGLAPGIYQMWMARDNNGDGQIVGSEVNHTKGGRVAVAPLYLHYRLEGLCEGEDPLFPRGAFKGWASYQWSSTDGYWIPMRVGTPPFDGVIGCLNEALTPNERACFNELRRVTF